MDNRYRTVVVVEWLLLGLVLAIICPVLAFGAALDAPGPADVTV